MNNPKCLAVSLILAVILSFRVSWSGHGSDLACSQRYEKSKKLFRALSNTSATFQPESLKRSNIMVLTRYQIF